MMQRLECLRAIYDRLEDCLVVTIMVRLPANCNRWPQANFFYLQHAMGLGSSTGLGLALCLPQQKWCLRWRWFHPDEPGDTRRWRVIDPKTWCMLFLTMRACSLSVLSTATSTGSDLEGVPGLPHCPHQDRPHNGRVHPRI